MLHFIFYLFGHDFRFPHYSVKCSCFSFFFFSGANEYAEIQHLAKPFICVKKQITLSLRQAKKEIRSTNKNRIRTMMNSHSMKRTHLLPISNDFSPLKAVRGIIEFEQLKNWKCH